VPGFCFHVGASASCPHGAQVQTISTNTRVLLNGMAAATVSDTFTIAGCPFVVPPPTTPQPCLLVKWIVPALRVKVNGQPVILQTSTGLCQNAMQLPQGAPIVSSTQTKVIAQ
jgi:hypothetical protein